MVQGPAVWALRAQTDKVEYSRVMRGVLESTENLDIREVSMVNVLVPPIQVMLSVQLGRGIVPKQAQACIAQLVCALGFCGL